MTRLTTALLTVAPRSIAPWGDRLWRVSLTAELVEGGSSAYWLVHPADPAARPVATDVVLISTPLTAGVVESLMLALAAHLGDEQTEGLLLDTHNIELLDGIRHVAPYWELTSSTSALLAQRLASSFRLGVTVLEELTLATADVVARLRGLGFDVDVFTLSDAQLAPKME